jgi:hypothetical protein
MVIKQEQSKSADEYLNRLREAMKNCQYGDTAQSETCDWGKEGRVGVLMYDTYSGGGDRQITCK